MPLWTSIRKIADHTPPPTSESLYVIAYMALSPSLFAVDETPKGFVVYRTRSPSQSDGPHAKRAASAIRNDYLKRTTFLPNRRTPAV